jgi:hypothetical protein
MKAPGTLFTASLLLSAPALAGSDCDTLASNVVNVTSNIATSTVWTRDNVYNLTTQIYVLPGASLTIEAGTTVATVPTPNGSGSLAVTRGAQIFVQGTAECPVIMTSTNDTATWAGGNRRSGTWREAANEWGNLTLMGRAYISDDANPTNVAQPGSANVAAMEGVTAEFPGDTKILYGGGDDGDDSGSIEYLSIRYGGRVIGLANELNGLSLGGIGAGTTISHVEIMNNVDDGIEIWGGTVNLDHVSIWNVGDDSLDIDQGYRGQIQFGLIVQGNSLNASQGSGVGDNCVEVDGAENSDWQPVTTTCIYNLTVIGQPVDGDGATAWRDNARVQYRNCIFMDCGEKVVRFDDVDGDGALGYGHNGTLDWLTSWATPFDGAPAHPNDGGAGLYTAQFSGNLCEISDSVLFNNSDYTEFNNVGADAPASNNVVEPAAMPIQALMRGTPVVRGGKVMLPVLGLDPRPAGDALTSVASAPAGGFLVPAPYRGAFAPDLDPWLGEWTASFAFGLTSSTGENTGQAFCFGDGSGATCPCGGVAPLGQGCPNSTGSGGAELTAGGDASLSHDTFQLSVSGVPGSRPGLILCSPNQVAGGAGTPMGNGLLCTGAGASSSAVSFTTGGSTTFSQFRPGISFGAASFGAGVTAHYQYWYRDGAGACGAGYNYSNAWSVTWQN